MTLDFNALANGIASTAVDQTKAKSGGGGDYTPPAEGLALLRLVGYVETGKIFKKGNPGKRIPDKNVDQAWLVFELHGPKYPVKENEDGTKTPVRMTVKMNTNYAGLSEKAGIFKLFRRMNYDGTATHFSQLLGKAYIANVRHNKWMKTVDGKEVEQINATFEDAERNLTIRPPKREVYDEDTGETSIKDVKVPEAISQLRLFVWNAPENMIGDLWNSLYIAKTGDGEYDPNVFQNAIKKSLSFEGSPIAQYLKANGQVADIPDAKKADDLGLNTDDGLGGNPDADDPLAGM